MNIDIKKVPTKIFALGGLEEIGKNTYVIENEDGIFIFDAGVKFANDDMLGMNGTVANYSYLQENEDKIRALFITHGHEDHIGGIPHLLRMVNIPVIHTPLLPAKLIEKKLAEHKDIKFPKIEVFDDDTHLIYGRTEIEFCRVCHSIPDSFMIFMKTDNGNIVSTGDFRFDFATAGDETNLKKLMEFSRRGVDVLLCESTSSDVAGFSESEKYIIDNLKTMLINATGRVLISTFASHLGRLEEIITVAVRLGRRIVILGKSMQENVKISRKIGYLSLSENDIINVKEIDNYRDDEILIILTGSQGEPTAALNTIANGEHSKIFLKPSDTIILSSNPIPGNFANVENMINNLYKKGVKIIENRPECRIHSSGHATRSEQQLMIKAIDPKYIFPIHGEYKMLRSLQNNAIDLGFPKENILITVNGHKLQLLDHELTYTDEYVNADPMFIDGKLVSTGSNHVIEQRESLGNNGIVNVLLYFNKEGTKLLTKPSITTRGCFFTKTSTSFLTKLSYIISSDIEAVISESGYDDEAIIEKVRDTAKVLIWRFKKKQPYVNVTIFSEKDYHILEKQQDNQESSNNQQEVDDWNNDEIEETVDQLDDINNELENDIEEVQEEQEENENNELINDTNIEGSYDEQDEEDNEQEDEDSNNETLLNDTNIEQSFEDQEDDSNNIESDNLEQDNQIQQDELIETKGLINNDMDQDLVSENIEQQEEEKDIEINSNQDELDFQDQTSQENTNTFEVKQFDESTVQEYNESETNKKLSNDFEPNNSNDEGSEHNFAFKPKHNEIEDNSKLDSFDLFKSVRSESIDDDINFNVDNHLEDNSKLNNENNGVSKHEEELEHEILKHESFSDEQEDNTNSGDLEE